MLIALLASIVVSAPAPAPAKTAPTASAKTGTLVVKALPWAACKVDGVGPKTTRFSRELGPGIHAINCSRFGHHKSDTVTIVAGQKIVKTFDFRGLDKVIPAWDPSTTNLVIEAKPWAKCTVAGQTRTTTVRRLLQPGTYPVVCSKGTDERKAVVVVAKGQVAKLSFDFRTPNPVRTRVKGQPNLIIKATPWAKCTVGKAKPKTTPISLSVKAGDHRVTCRKGKKTQTRIVTVAPRVVVYTKFKFPTAGPSGPPKGPPNLMVRAKPWAKCTVDGGGPRTTPFSQTVKPGPYTVVCTQGKTTKNQQVTVKKGKASVVTMDFR